MPLKYVWLFTMPIFTKLASAQRHKVGMFNTKLHQNWLKKRISIKEKLCKIRWANQNFKNENPTKVFLMHKHTKWTGVPKRCYKGFHEVVTKGFKKLLQRVQKSCYKGFNKVVTKGSKSCYKGFLKVPKSCYSVRKIVTKGSKIVTKGSKKLLQSVPKSCYKGFQKVVTNCSKIATKGSKKLLQRVT
jgi:hypothetical protein